MILPCTGQFRFKPRLVTPVVCKVPTTTTTKQPTSSGTCNLAVVAGMILGLHKIHIIVKNANYNNVHTDLAPEH